MDAGLTTTTIANTKADTVLGLLYQDLAQPSVKTVGNALGEVFQFCTTPLLLLKFGSEVARINFKKHIDNYQKKIDSITEEFRIPVPPQVGAPIIEKLSYTTNEEIADLFTNLLTKASSSDTINLAHPAFIQIVERLSVDEARIIKYLDKRDTIPCITFRAYHKPETVNEDLAFNDTFINSTLIKFENNLLFPDNINTYLDNLTSLGILEKPNDQYLISSPLYEDLALKYNYEIYKKAYMENGKFSKFELRKGFFEITNFGKTFINACTENIDSTPCS